MRNSSVSFRIILFVMLILSAAQAFPQGKFEISGGLGLPELTNIKLKYGQNIQVGACLHYWHYSQGGIFSAYNDWSCAAELTYHFSGGSKYIDQPTWYLLGALGYYHIDYLIDWPYDYCALSFYPRIGRTINFSKRTGLNMDLGLFIPLSASTGNPYKLRILPSGSISFFVRL
jgi:hypothetical protein